MTEYTARLGLYKPGGGGTGTNLPDEAADIDRLNQNFDAIDAAVGVPRVTSTTHPPIPWPGMVIYEIDTGKFLSWDDIAFEWDEVSRPIPDASTTVKGIQENATDAETATGTATDRTVTPASLASLTATTSRRGLAEFATDAETIAGSSDSLAVTPSGLGAALAPLEALPLVQRGWVATVGNTASEQDVVVTFPEPFADTPVVVAVLAGYKPGTGEVSDLNEILALGSNTTDARPAPISSTGCTIRYTRASGAWGGSNRYVVTWIAVGTRVVS